MFKPNQVLFEKEALEYPLGKEIYDKFKKENIQIVKLNSNRVPSIKSDDLKEKYSKAKQTLVIGVRRSFKFQTCKPSAHYQLPLVTGCMGQCEYCYLNTRFGNKPYIRTYVNVEEILDQAKKYIEKREGVTIFEGAATSDPLPVEPYTHGLKKSIDYFSRIPNARFRFVTKYNNINSLLDLDHKGHTTIRFSLNTEKIIKNHEHFTSSAKKRIEAASKIYKAGYPLGFIIAPVFLYDGWKNEYRKLIEDISKSIEPNNSNDITFEIISHRYTLKAKEVITKIFPDTTLPMKEEDRRFKYGQFGYGKYMYTKEQINEIQEFFTKEISRIFTDKSIKYII
ncbi:spore photoproduct lyase [Senegalia massiliensis]|uniref:spore photoproduct lyase n=1 Tax=Senegalia massiliensis TaxID=1720316 RepID=UPI00103078D6|nr:spore photoproduct lyase [Senegalia massiliensis]